MKLTYHRCGDYLLPALTIPDESVTLGKYGRMRKTYSRTVLQNHKIRIRLGSARISAGSWKVKWRRCKNIRRPADG